MLSNTARKLRQCMEDCEPAQWGLRRFRVIWPHCETDAYTLLDWITSTCRFGFARRVFSAIAPIRCMNALSRPQTSLSQRDVSSSWNARDGSHVEHGSQNRGYNLYITIPPSTHSTWPVM